MKYTISEDRCGDITVSHPEEKDDVFLQFESEKELVLDILTDEEKNWLSLDGNVEIEDNEPRASILSELFNLSNE